MFETNNSKKFSNILGNNISSTKKIFNIIHYDNKKETIKYDEYYLHDVKEGIFLCKYAKPFWEQKEKVI